jgi:transposase InsO family protein
VEESDKGRGELMGSAPLGGEGGAARRGTPERYFRKNGATYARHYPFETKLRAVKLYLEEKMPSELVAKEVGVPAGTIFWWLQNYRKYGEAGLRRKPSVRKANRPDAVGEKIATIKKNNPHYGVKRISHILQRLFLLKASSETVRRRLKKAGLGTKRKKARKKPEPKIHFFERTSPNETWQSDISTVQILGKNAYVIAFIDDYSRYIVSHGLFRNQTAEYVLDVYRTAAATYGIPKEMLTDNGRQYASWHGLSKFGKELKKDHVHHIRSQPHHPQTLGKIERFWKTLKEEFLDRARFETFEEAQERVKFWIKYYNHKRPHQGIGGVCPADRYFSVQKELRQVIEKGMEENAEELALRGVPVKPFYMVGQMGEQSVVIRSEKGKLRMLVGGEEGREIVYDLKEKRDEDGREGCSEIPEVESVQREREVPGCIGAVVGEENAIGALRGVRRELGHSAQLGDTGNGRHDTGAGSGVEGRGAGRDTLRDAGRGVAGEDGERTVGRRKDSGAELRETVNEDGNNAKDMERGREMPGSAGGMDGTQEVLRNLAGDGREREPAESMARPGDGRNAGCAGTAADERNINERGVGVQGEETAGQEGALEGERVGVEVAEENAETAGKERDAGIIPEKETDGTDNRQRFESNGKTEVGGSGPERPDESHGSSGRNGGESQDVLQMGAARTGSDEGGIEGERLRAARADGGRGEGSAEAGDRGLEEGVALTGAEASHP